MAMQEWQKRCLAVGFKYWRAPDDHWVECTPEQAAQLLAEVLGVQVQIKPSVPADQRPVTPLAEDAGDAGLVIDRSKFS